MTGSRCASRYNLHTEAILQASLDPLRSQGDASHDLSVTRILRQPTLQMN